MIDLDLLRREGLFAAEAADEIERLRAALEAILLAVRRRLDAHHAASIFGGDLLLDLVQANIDFGDCGQIARRALEQPAAIDPRTLRETLP